MSMTLENKNCLDYLSTIEDESVDLVLTDPPYFIGFDGGKGWDSQWKTEEEYLAWRKEKVAETDLFWEELRMKYRNGGNERRIMDKVRDWLRFVRNRLR